MKRVWLIINLIWLAAMLNSPAQAQLTAVDHFRCYLVPISPVFQVTAQLQDQFDAASGTFEDITQLLIQRFCNPVQKTVNGVVTPIVNVNHHLTMFTINTQPIIMRQVIVKNQFGQQTLSTADAKILAVPTGKGLPPNPAPAPPTDLDHYKCYTASGPALTNVIANLKDQFISENVAVLRPVLFCNPVKKIHNGVTTGILHPDVHLTCYSTQSSTFAGTTININNQFVVLNSLRLRVPDLLCAPSEKLQWSVVTGTGTAEPHNK